MNINKFWELQDFMKLTLSVAILSLNDEINVWSFLGSRSPLYRKNTNILIMSLKYIFNGKLSTLSSSSLIKQKRLDLPI